MLREFFMRPSTGKIDWWMVTLMLASLFSFVGAAILARS
jgi:hypothetical protein